MRIGVISQWYDPERSSAAQPGVIARSLAARGHDVHVVTGFPNYPTGRIYPGYRIRPYQRETLRGVTVHRSALYASHDRRAASRAANYLTFAGGATAIALSQLPRPDVVLVHGTPATAAAPALALKRLRRVPFVYQVQDLWPETVLHSGFLRARGGRVESALHRYCDVVYAEATTVAVTSPGMVRRIESRGVHPGKITFLPNWTDERCFRPISKDPALAAQLGIRRRFTVMYAGAFGEYQALDVLLEAARLLRDRHDIGFALVGEGVEEARLRQIVDEGRLHNVVFVPPQPFERMADILALGDAQLISLRPYPLFESTLPSKVQATMAAGRPMIGAVSGDAAEVIMQSGGGLVVPPGSPTALAETILDLADSAPERVQKMGAEARAFYEARYGEKVVSARMVEVLTDAAKGAEA